MRFSAPASVASVLRIETCSFVAVVFILVILLWTHSHWHEHGHLRPRVFPLVYPCIECSCIQLPCTIRRRKKPIACVCLCVLTYNQHYEQTGANKKDFYFWYTQQPIAYYGNRSQVNRCDTQRMSVWRHKNTHAECLCVSEQDQKAIGQKARVFVVQHFEMHFLLLAFQSDWSVCRCMPFVRWNYTKVFPLLWFCVSVSVHTTHIRHALWQRASANSMNSRSSILPHIGKKKAEGKARARTNNRPWCICTLPQASVK